jgi:hypothetical protein
MNPSPTSPRPFNPPPRLVDTRLPPPGHVPVTLTRGLPATIGYLDTIERLWAPERSRLAEELRANGETLESAHWEWRNKALRQPHWHTLVAIECDGAVQGIMAVENHLRGPNSQRVRGCCTSITLRSLLGTPGYRSIEPARLSANRGSHGLERFSLARQFG